MSSTSVSVVASFASSSAPPVTPPSPAPEVTRALSIAEARGKRVGSKWSISEQTAKEILGPVRKWKGDVTSASVEPVGDGFGALLWLVLQCEGDSCSTETWLVLPGGPRKLKVGGGTVVVLPDLSAVIADAATFNPYDLTAERVSGANSEWIARIERVDVATGTSKAFAPCVSPVLSPSRKYIVCRSRKGAVLRVPVSGGPPEVVRGPAKQTPAWVPYAYVYPGPVEFVSTTELRVHDEPGGSSMVAYSEP